MIIISIIIFLSVFFLLRDLHIEVYDWVYTLQGKRCVKINEYDFKYRVWHIMVIPSLSFLPVINVMAFLGFLAYYAIHYLWDPYDCDGITHVFKSKYVNKLFNFISSLVSKVLNFLNKEI